MGENKNNNQGEKKTENNLFAIYQAYKREVLKLYLRMKTTSKNPAVIC